MLKLVSVREDMAEERDIRSCESFTLQQSFFFFK